MAAHDNAYRDSLELMSDNVNIGDIDAPPAQARTDATITAQTRAVLRPRWLQSSASGGRGIRRFLTLPAYRRVTIRGIALLSSLLYILYCFVVGSPLFASRLPGYSGPYQVGTADIEVPVRTKRNISNVVYKASGLPAFELNTVLASVFYPAADTPKSEKKLHTWLDRPISALGAGYSRAAHFDNIAGRSLLTFGLWLLAGSIEIPAGVDAPLITSRSDDKSEKLPVIIFSHGTASSRTDYTHFCGELASHGVVVVAVEHRDGSGPASLLLAQDGTEVGRVMYTNAADLSDGQPLTVEAFKRHQLAFRTEEIKEIYWLLKDVNVGGLRAARETSRRETDSLTNWSGRLDLEHLVVAGHSYGATGALQALAYDKSTEALPVAGAIALDPGKSSGKFNEDINVPILVVHSNSWSREHTIFYGRPHFDTVYDLVEAVQQRVGASWFVTSMGTSHPSITDAPLIEPLLLSWTTGATINAKKGVDEYATIAGDFMKFVVSAERHGVLARPVSHRRYDESVDKDRAGHGLPDKIDKNWQIHIAPAVEQRHQ